MAIGTPSLELAGGGRPLEPLFFDRITFLGDDSYPTGGTADFAATVAEALGKEGIEIVAVMKAGACGGYDPIYNKADGKLLMYEYDNDALANGPAVEVGPATALDGVTFDLIVLYR